MGIDYFFGDPVYIHHEDPTFDRPAWMSNAKKLAADAVPKWLDAVRETYGMSKLEHLYVCSG